MHRAKGTLGVEGILGRSSRSQTAPAGYSGHGSYSYFFECILTHFTICFRFLSAVTTVGLRGVDEPDQQCSGGRTRLVFDTRYKEALEKPSMTPRSPRGAS